MGNNYQHPGRSSERFSLMRAWQFRSREGLGNVRKEAVPAAVKVTVSLDDIVPAFRVEELGSGVWGSGLRIEGLGFGD